MVMRARLSAQLLLPALGVSAVRQAYSNALIAAATPVDFTRFESDVLPQWLQGFQLVGTDSRPVDGAFRKTLGGPQAVYGSADVIHLLSTVNQLNFSDAKRDAWAAVMASFQNVTVTCNSDSVCPGLPLESRWPGFYMIQGGDELSSGDEPWHSTGDITSSFYLLHRWPAAPNPMYQQIAKNESLWEQTFLPGGHVLGIHKIIGILGTLLMQEPNAKETYAPFLRWWAEFIDEHEQMSTGFLANNSSSCADVPQCKCNEPLCTGDKCLAGPLEKCVAPTFATNMIKHIGLNW